MRKLLCFVICLFGILHLNAQEGKKYYMYGVDFTSVKVYGADESVMQFTEAFKGINMLLIMEPDKYDSYMMVNSPVDVIIEPIMKKNAEADFSGIMTYSSYVDSVDCDAIVKEYTLPQTEGTGIVFIARMLNKPEAIGIYDLVVFDIATRDVIERREVIGKAGGFGLRNYWARSIYRIMSKTVLY